MPIDKQTKTVIRYDKGDLSQVRKLDNGYLLAPGRITRVGVFDYRDAKGKIVRELRIPDEVFNRDALDSFSLAPLTNNHPDEGLDSKNTHRFQVGTVSDVRQDQEFVAAQIQITDEKAIEDVESGKQELSCGYTAELEFTPGITQGIVGVRDGLQYDAIQRNIRGNHVAIVDKGRAGSNASIRLDESGAIMGSEITEPKTSKVEKMKFKIDGITIEVDESHADVVTQAIAKRDKAIEDLEAAIEQAKGATTTETARADKAEEDLAATKKDLEEKTAPEIIQERIADRLSLERSAGKILGEKDADDKEIKLDEMSDLDIRRAVILKVSPGAKDKIKDADESYIAARYDQAIDSHKGEPAPRTDGISRVLRFANDSDQRTDAADARQKMIDHNRKLGREPIGKDIN